MTPKPSSSDFYAAVGTGELILGQAVATMRRISELTQPEFATHRGLSVQVLRQIEADRGNPTVETLDKIASIFGLQVGFVPRSVGQSRNRPSRRNRHESSRGFGPYE